MRKEQLDHSRCASAGFRCLPLDLACAAVRSRGQPPRYCGDGCLVGRYCRCLRCHSLGRKEAPGTDPHNLRCAGAALYNSEMGVVRLSPMMRWSTRCRRFSEPYLWVRISRAACQLTGALPAHRAFLEFGDAGATWRAMWRFHAPIAPGSSMDRNELASLVRGAV